MARRGFLVLGFAALALLGAPGARAGLPAPPVFKWQRCPAAYCETGWYASPAVADLDRNGQVDVFWGGYTLLAVNGATGALEWSYAPSGNGRLWPDIAIADLFGDHQQELVVAQYAQLSVLDGAGRPLASWPAQPFASGEIRTLAVADLDGDHQREILVADAASTGTGQWTVLEPNATTRAGWPRLQDGSGGEGYAWGCYNENVAVADLDGDGRGEIVGSSDVHYLASFEDDGTQIAANALFGAGKLWSQVNFNYDQAEDIQGYSNCAGPLDPRPNFASSAPVIADLDGDGSLEIVVIGNFYDCSGGTEVDLFQMPLVLERDRSRWAAGSYDWTALPVPDGKAGPLSQDSSVIEDNQPNAVVADLDGDGEKEILFPSYDGRLHAYWLDKTEHGSWPYDLNPTPHPIRFATPPAVVDLDGDGKAEVIFATWTEHGSNAYGRLVILSDQGQELGSVELPHTPPHDWGGSLAAPTVANIDGDPDLEVVVGTTDAGLVAYDLPGTAGAQVRWGTGRGNLARTAPEPDAGTAALALLGCAWLGRRAPAPRLPGGGRGGILSPCDSRPSARRASRSRASASAA